MSYEYVLQVKQILQIKRKLKLKYIFITVNKTKNLASFKTGFTNKRKVKIKKCIFIIANITKNWACFHIHKHSLQKFFEF